jgi:thymidylate synthase (FAD)
MTAPTFHADPLQFMEDAFLADRAKGLFKKTRGLEVITPSVELIGVVPDGETIMRHLEAAIRTAYKSEDKIGPGSAEKILKHILSLKHESTLEHISLSFRVITNRGVTHELVRSRIGVGYTQESTRYVNYGKRPPQVILPWHLVERSDDDKAFWLRGQRSMIKFYQEALARDWKPQDARGFLDNDLKTEIVWTMNIRAFRHFMNLRTAASAHPDMQVIARKALQALHGLVPLLFRDIQDRVDALVGAA